jgi:hypothetical protein
MRRKLVPIAVLAIFAGGGCGSGDDDSGKAAATTPQQAPAKLLGTYTTTLKPADLPANAPDELTHSSPRWKLTIANTGGVDGGAAFAIANDENGSLENPPFTVSGHVIELQHEECGAGGQEKFYENSYRYELSGKSLTLTKVKNLCPDEVALTILTSQPWTKVK